MLDIVEARDWIGFTGWMDSEVQNSDQISIHNHRVLCSGPGHGPCPRVHCARQYQANNHMSCP